MAGLFLFFSITGKIAACFLWTHPRLRAFAALSFLLPDLILLYQLLIPSARGLVPVLTRFATERNEIWLTIDDGPDAHDTPQILDLLERHQARATFFPIGQRAAQHPGLIAEILRRGHEVGHHTHTHPLGSFWCASRTRVARELDEGLAALHRGGAQPRWFRGPAGIKNIFLARALAARDLRCVGWNVRSFDSVGRDPAAIVQRVMRRLRPGAIVLMHEGPALHPQVRVHALRLLLEALTGRGFTCVLPRPEQLR